MTRKTLLILGANGMLGGSLHRYFSNVPEFFVIGTVRSSQIAKKIAEMGFSNIRSGIDVTDYQSLERLIAEISPDYVFNCIGLIKQLAEAKLPVPAIEINSLLPHKLAALCTKYNSKLVHFSTDCVFSGETGDYSLVDTPDAVDIYGRSKLLGEVDYDGHLTLRTSIIGHEIDSQVSLVDWFLSQSGTVKGFSGAVFSGLPTCYVAEFIHSFVFPNQKFSGLYHLSVEPIDKFKLLSLVKAVYQTSTEIVEDSAFKIDRSLNSDMLRDELKFSPPVWSTLIEKMHNEYVKYFAKN